jgi:glycogen phosphorylase
MTRLSQGSDLAVRLHRIALNLWWTWNPEAQRLFAAMDPALYDAMQRSPIRTMRHLSPERWWAIRNDPQFVQQLDQVESQLKQYLGGRTWYQRTARGAARSMTVAYFCAEYALHESLPIYSGGLGVLAGDHLKSASDLGVPLVAVGLLYRRAFYTQQFEQDGSTRVIYPQLDFADMPLTSTGRQIEVPIGTHRTLARIWHADVGRVPLFLLDTDLPENSRIARELTHHLYGGDREYRIRQEVLLGVGGLMALEAMEIDATVFHLNEGHAAFAALERVRRVLPDSADLEQAKKKVRASCVFTTHTPVPAGNDRFDPKLTLKYIGSYAQALEIDRHALLGLGREDPADKSEPFCMTVLALRLAAHCNGVAELHGQTSRAMWQRVFGQDDPNKVPIGHITNGVHSETWLAPEIRPLYDRYLKPHWTGAGPEDDWWRKVDQIPDQELWAIRGTLRARLVQFIRTRLREQILRGSGGIEQLVAAHEVFDDQTLTIGFARRFATYKRAPLIFRDPQRLAKILSDPQRPVQLIFAGKAHPQDTGGQAFAQQIFHHAHSRRFRGRVVLLEDYDMQLGRVLTSGCDVWLNNPLRPQEASGTSGMKPPLHGGINCSVLDGWWPEGFNGRNGWAIGDGRQFKSQAKQDRYDAECIYQLLEQQIVPAFYERERGPRHASSAAQAGATVPSKWIGMMRESMKTVCGRFSTHRMVGQYVREAYLPAHRA